MSINKHLKANGVKLSEDNSLPPGSRTQKSVKRLINAVRAAEGEFNDALRDSERRAAIAQQQVIELQQEVERLRAIALKQELSTRMDSIDSISVAEKQYVIEAAE